MAWVVNGKVAEEDKHDGIASIPGTQNTYRLTISAGTECKNGCILRAVVCGGGGNDS